MEYKVSRRTSAWALCHGFHDVVAVHTQGANKMLQLHLLLSKFVMLRRRKQVGYCRDDEPVTCQCTSSQY